MNALDAAFKEHVATRSSVLESRDIYLPVIV
jgi:hypothetical protein